MFLLKFILTIITLSVLANSKFDATLEIKNKVYEVGEDVKLIAFIVAMIFIW